jgi:hypothetical protein
MFLCTIKKIFNSNFHYSYFLLNIFCRANKATWGSPGFKWLYEITITGNSGTLVCCEGYSPVDRSSHTIGCGSDSFELKLDWGNIVAYSMIKCRGYPFGAFVSWD